MATWLVSVLAPPWRSVGETVATLMGLQLAAHVVIGMIAAAGGLLRSGVGPEPVGEVFQTPLRSLLAANGAAPGVGLWLTGSAVAMLVTAIAYRRHRVGRPPRLAGPAAEAAYVVSVGVVAVLCLIALSFVVTPAGLRLSTVVEPPGSLGGLPEITHWARPALAVRGFLLVAGGCAAACLSVPAAGLNRVGRAAGQALMLAVAVVGVAAVVVLIAGALRLPDNPSPQEWAAQAIEYLATWLVAGLDLGADELVRASASPLGGGGRSQLSGAWAPVLLATVMGVTAALQGPRLRRATHRAGLLSALAAPALAGLLVSAGPVVNGAEGVSLSGAATLVLAVLSAAAAAAPGQVAALVAGGRPPGAAVGIRSGSEIGGPPAGPGPVVIPPDICAACLTPLPIGARFCGGCGRSTSARPDEGGVVPVLPRLVDP